MIAMNIWHICTILFYAILTMDLNGKDKVLECIINCSKYHSHLSSSVQEGNSKPVIWNLIYSANELKALREMVLHNRRFRTLPLVAVNNIRRFNLHKIRRRGHKMGNKKQDPRFADLSNLDNIKLDTNNNKRSDDGKVFRISEANAQSIRNKDLLFHDHIYDNKIDVCIITDTWLHDTDRDRAWLYSVSVNSDPLNILSSNRKNRTGGGLAIMYKKPLKVTEFEECMTNTFLYAIW